MTVAAPTEHIIVGRITGPYGIKGWLRLHSYTDPAENLLSYTGLMMKRGRDWQPLDIKASRKQGKGFVVQIGGIDDRNAAEALGKGEIAVPRDSLPDLDEDEYYWHQLEGLDVELGLHSPEGVGSDGEESDASTSLKLGVVDHLIATGANDVLVVKPTSDSRDDKTRLIPYLRGDVVREIDLQAGVIRVSWDPDF